MPTRSQGREDIESYYETCRRAVFHRAAGEPTAIKITAPSLADELALQRPKVEAVLERLAKTEPRIDRLPGRGYIVATR